MQPTMPSHFSQYTSLNFIHQYINTSIDEQPLHVFLSELFHDLFRRSSTEHNNKNTAITKLTFIEGLGLPLIISERLFYAFTNNRFAKCITKTEFIKGFTDLYTNDMDKKLKIVSKMFDFDLNGMLRVDDITLLFIHFYYFSIGTANCFESFKEIENIIHKALTPKKKITLRSFENIINNYNADTFYLFLFFLNKYRPFTNEQVKYFYECSNNGNTHITTTDNSFTVDKENCIVFTPNNNKSSNTPNHSNNNNMFRNLIDIQTNHNHARTIRTKLDIEPTQELINLLCKQSVVVLNNNDNDDTKHNAHDSDHNNVDDELSDLNDLEMFEEDLLSAISKIEYCFVPKCNTNKLIKKQSKSFSILTSDNMHKQTTFTLHPELPPDKPQQTPKNKVNNDDNISIKNVRTFNTNISNNSNNNISSISIIASKSNSKMEIPINRKIDFNFTSSPKKKHYMHSKTININEPRTPQTHKSKVINFTSSIISAQNASPSSPLNKYRQSTKKSMKYSGSITPKRSSKEELNIEYHNTNNYFEIHVNYYTRSGAIRDCILLIIDDVIFVHIFNGFCYKYLKMINMKCTLIEEIEIWETLSNSVLRRIKLSSFLNKTYKEMIFSSADQQQMDAFIAKVKHISKYQNDINIKYKSIKEIYRGTKSKLFLGENTTTKDKVAIKYINLSLCSKQESYETMLWEFDLMQLLRKTNHKNIVKVYDLYKTTEHFIFVLEYIPHGNLKSYLIENRYTLSKSNHKRIIQQLANAVLFLHSNGIIHRDLKPENILVKVKDKNKIKIKLIDLGFGKVIGKGKLLTEPYGTFCYASPEVLKKVPYTFETDIWSLGVIFYLIVVGVHPFGENDKDLKTIHKNICDVVYAFPNDSDVNAHVKDVIELCLRKEPKQRPKINDIVKLIKKISITSTTTTTTMELL